VRKHGDTALINYANRFDSPCLNIETLQAGMQEYEDAVSQVSPEFMESLDAPHPRLNLFTGSRLKILV